MDYHALVSMVIFHQKTSVMMAGNQKRTEAVSRDVIENQINTVEWVEATEAHRLLFVNQKAVLAHVGGCSDRPFTL